MEDSTILRFSSKVPWACETISPKIIDKLRTKPKEIFASRDVGNTVVLFVIM
jgi:hypothetical protein